MKSSNYIVEAKNVYVGEVVKTSNIFKNQKTSDVMLLEETSYRSMIFTINEDKMSEDLLYDSPNYPIINVTNEDKYVEYEDIIVVKTAYELTPLLKYDNYKNYLTADDILNIRKTYFDGEYYYKYRNLFGYELENNNDSDEMSIEYELMRKRNLNNFIKLNEGVLPSKYFYILKKFGNNTLLEVIDGYARDIDSFKPSKEEGNIRKLIR